MPKAYVVLKTRILQDVVFATVGDTVFDCIKPDYGSANTDGRLTGIEHRSVTKDPDGDYPFFTIPVFDLRKLP